MLDTVLEYVGALTALFIGIMIIVKVAGITIIGNDSPLYTVYTGLITTVGDVFSALGMVLVIGALIMVLGLVYAIKGRTGGGGTV